jgi:subtilase family serine protease
MRLAAGMVATSILASGVLGNAGARPLQTHAPLSVHRAAVGVQAAPGWSTTATQAVRFVPGVADLGAAPAAMPMRVTVGLQPRNEAAAEAYVRREYTKGDALYHHFLTPAQYTAAFAPSAAAATAVARYLASAGFKQITVAPNNMLVSATGTAATVDSAFNTSIHSFNAQGQALYANVTPALVPNTLGGSVVSVLGLNNQRLQTFLQFKNGHRPSTVRHINTAHRGRTSTVPGTIAPGASGCILPSFVAAACLVGSYYSDDIERMYDVQSEPPASNTNIAIMTVADTNQLISDLRVNENVNGLRQVPVTVVNADPAFHYPGGQPIGGNQLEFSMDTQSSTGFAGDANGLYIYNVGDLVDPELAQDINRWVTDDVAQVASLSAGECESNALTDGAMAIDDFIFVESVAQGQSFFTGSGDSGMTCGFTLVTNGVLNEGPPMVAYPASSAWVLSAGGTTPIVNTDGTYGGEIAWPWSGGGVSYFEAPAWFTYGVQPGWIPNFDGLAGGGVPGVPVGSGFGRTTPDVAMDADGNVASIIFFEYGAQQANAGTSLASPLSAGAYARLQSLFGNQLGNAGPTLYGAYAHYGGGWIGSSVECYGAALDGPPAPCTPSAPTPPPYLATPPNLTGPVAGFNDIQYGNNGLYPALVGYDMVTGMGSFDLNKMAIAFGR